MEHLLFDCNYVKALENCNPNCAGLRSISTPVSYLGHRLAQDFLVLVLGDALAGVEWFDGHLHLLHDSLLEMQFLQVLKQATRQVKTGKETGNQSGTETGNQSGTETGNQPGTETVNQSGTCTETVNQSGTETGNKSGTETGNQSGTETGNKSGTETGNKSGTETVNKSGI